MAVLVAMIIKHYPQRGIVPRYRSPLPFLDHTSITPLSPSTSSRTSLETPLLLANVKGIGSLRSHLLLRDLFRVDGDPIVLAFVVPSQGKKRRSEELIPGVFDTE